MSDERPFWHHVHPSSNDWLPELQRAWVELWTGDRPPRASAVALAEDLWHYYNEIARRRRGAPLPPPRTEFQPALATTDDTDLAFHMLECEALVGITASDRDRLGITALLGPGQP